jgi:hypothetical protein
MITTTDELSEDKEGSNTGILQDIIPWYLAGGTQENQENAC